jgi:hypothetical protein
MVLEYSQWMCLAVIWRSESAIEAEHQHLVTMTQVIMTGPPAHQALIAAIGRHWQLLAGDPSYKEEETRSKQTQIAKH